MGTKVHYKSYLPSYYPMRDLNKEESNSWSFCCEDRTLSGKLCSGFTPRLANGYTVYDKEILKQTMLRHEQIFRKQVCELHRLYRIQRGLMDELKRKEEHNFFVQVPSSHSIPFSTKMLPKDTEKSWQGDGITSPNSSCSRTTVSGVGDARTHLSFLNGSSGQTGLASRGNGDSKGRNKLMHSNIEKFPRRVLDLQLPADAYIDNEDTEHAEEKMCIKSLFTTSDPSNIKCVFLPGNDVKLSLGIARNHSSRGETQNSSSHLRKGIPHNLADLNEPLKVVSCKEVIASPCKFSVQTTHCERLQVNQDSMETASDFLGCQKDFFKDTYKGGGSVFPKVDSGEKGWRCPRFKSETEQLNSHMKYFTSDCSNTDVRLSSEHVVIKPRNAQGFSPILSAKQKGTELWSGEKPSQSIELSDGSFIASTKYSGLTVPTMPFSLSALPHTDNARNASSLLSNRTCLTPLVVQAFPCFSESTMNIQSRGSSTASQNVGNACEKGHYNHGSRSTTSFGGGAQFCPNGLHHIFQSESSASSHVYLPSVHYDKPNLNNSDCSSYEKLEGNGLQKCLKGSHGTDVKTENDMNLDLAPPNGFQVRFSPQENNRHNVEGKKAGLPGGLSWLRAKSPCSEPLSISNDVPQKELGTLQGYSPLMLNYPASTQEVGQKKETEGIPPSDDLPSILKAKGIIMQLNESSTTSSSKRIPGFHVHQKTQWSSPADNVENSIKEKFPHSSTSFHSKLLGLKKQIHMELDLEKGAIKCLNGFRDHIDLNFCAISMDKSKSSESSAKDEVQLLSSLSVQDTATRFVFDIDLEKPITSQVEEQMPPAESALHCNQLPPVESEDKRESPRTSEIEDETIVRMAAETICVISLETCIHPEDCTSCPSPPALADTLHWFANVATTNTDDLENVLEASRDEGDVGQGSSDINGMDYFEYMTLKLKEIKVDEYCFIPSEIETKMEEETSIAHLLLTKPRRGPGRKRRQRRDFQKDILPGLASLSRNEVTEDLQFIVGLMSASGHSWQGCESRKNDGRNRSYSQRRGRGRPRGTAAVPVVEITLDPQPTQPSNAVNKNDGSSILGWGRTTRRCWRQRCSSGNILVPT